MTIERAIEILDPKHREYYETIDPVEEACCIGINALQLKILRSPYPDGDKDILACPNCGSGEYLYNEDGAENSFCGQCGQAIDWSESYHERE